VGEITGAGNLRVPPVTRRVTTWHRFLGNPPNMREVSQYMVEMKKHVGHMV